jgi:hypothetical protein
VKTTDSVSLLVERKCGGNANKKKQDEEKGGQKAVPNSYSRC